jgi:hypothetical protein
VNPLKRLLIVAACLSIAATTAFGVTLQSMYDKCGAGEGYDKLCVLDPDVKYTGGCGVLLNKKSCIRGNGALVDLDGGSILGNQFGTEVTVDGCCLINAGYYGAVKVEDGAKAIVTGNTITKTNGIAAVYIWLSSSATIKNNIIYNSKTYGIAKHQSSGNVEILYNDVDMNPGGNYMYYCPG